jgi:hypothetical protein
MTIQSLLGMIPLHYKHIKTSKDKYCGKYCLKILSNTDEGFGIGCRQTVTCDDDVLQYQQEKDRKKRFIVPKNNKTKLSNKKLQLYPASKQYI